MKFLFTLAIGFSLGLYFADYRAVRVVKRQVVTLVQTADAALR